MDRVAEAEVAVDDSRWRVGGLVLEEPLVHPVHPWHLAGLRALPLLAPALQLAPDVAGPLGQVAEPDVVGVDGVKRDDHVDQRFTRPAPGGVVTERVGVFDRVQHGPGDVAHHVEGGLVDRRVGAHPDHPRHGHTGVAQRVHDPVLAGDVVGGRQHVADRRSPQHRPAHPPHR